MLLIIARNATETASSPLDAVDEIVSRIARDMGGTLKVIATGGLASLMADGPRTIQAVDPILTLKGLRVIWLANRLQLDGGGQLVPSDQS